MNNSTRQHYGLTTLICVVVAGMIGSGVFTTSGYSLAGLRSPALVLLAWLIGGLIALCGAVAYGALAVQLPESGGEYLYLHRRLHPFAGFLTGWVSLTAGFSGSIALSAITFAEYVPTQRLGLSFLSSRDVAILVVLLCGAGHSFLIRGTAVVQNVVVAVKVLLLAAFVVLAASSGLFERWHWEPLADSEGEASRSQAGLLSGIAVMATSLMWISLSYAGFNSAIYVASEVDQPQRSVPRAMLIGTTLTTVIYLLLNGIFVTAAPADQLAGQPDVAAIAARHLGGTSPELLIRLCIGLATLSSVASMIMTGPRIYSRMADDGLLPAFFRSGPGSVHRTVMLQTALAVLLILTATLRDLLSYLGTTLSLSSAVTVATVFRRTPGVTATVLQKLAAAVYLTATLIFVVLMSVDNYHRLNGTIITLLAGSVLWVIMSLKRTSAPEPESGAATNCSQDDGSISEAVQNGPNGDH